MKYSIFYDPFVEKQLEKMPNQIAIRIIKKIRDVGETGRGIETLKDENYRYKVRIGDYRVLVDIMHNPHQIIVRYIDHRRRIYKNL